MKTIFYLVAIIISMSFFAMENDFEMHEITNNFNEGMDVFSIDFDADGDFDILAAGTDCILLLNDGSGNFSQEMTLGNTSWARSIRAADLDGDSDNDVVIADITSNSILVLENLGTSFSQFVLDNSFVMPHTVDVKDLDSDGDLDILCCEFDMSNELSEVAWWENLGCLNFSGKNVISEIFQQSTFVIADFIDSDEHMDVVACGEILNDVVWWQNDGEENFGEGFYIDQNISRIHTIIGKDLDMDDDIDVLGAACMSGYLAWWENDGEGDFNRHNIGSFGGALWMDCADFDNDGDNDLFAVGQGPSCAYIFENIGDEVFEEYPLPGVFNDGFGATAADFDNDGDMDLAAIGRSSDQICWWENKLISTQFSAAPLSGHIPLEVQFTDESNFLEPILLWFWDFNNDGSFESNEQHPTYIFEEPEVYSVSLMIMTETFTKSVVYEDYISVFNGESALYFDGDESYANCPSSESLNLTNEITLEAWIEPTSYGSVPNLGFGRIFDKEKFSLYLAGESPSFNNHSLVFEFKNENDEIFRCNTPENSISLDSWQHVAVTYDSIDEVKMFIQGAEQTLSNSGTPTGYIADNSDFDLLMGNSQTLFWSFEGLIDEVRCWNTVRSDTDIQIMMLYHLSGNEAGLVGCWQMNEGNGEILNDLSPFEHTADISNAIWSQGIELIPTAIEEENVIDFQEPVSLHSYPNPFNTSTTISFQISSEQNKQKEIEIYNLKGQKIRTFHNHQMNQSVNRQIVWDGRNESGKQMNSGIYFYHLQIDQRPIITKRMILMR